MDFFEFADIRDSILIFSILNASIFLCCVSQTKNLLTSRLTSLMTKFYVGILINKTLYCCCYVIIAAHSEHVHEVKVLLVLDASDDEFEVGFTAPLLCLRSQEIHHGRILR